MSGLITESGNTETEAEMLKSYEIHKEILKRVQTFNTSHSNDQAAMPIDSKQAEIMRKDLIFLSQNEFRFGTNLGELPGDYWQTQSQDKVISAYKSFASYIQDNEKAKKEAEEYRNNHPESSEDMLYQYLNAHSR